ncbi:hypothetical protein [Streptomyces kaniharaensis]|uniref:hypothetical protein n=1 Tax=Streptomyces kaniharaensis TaxID=212423 RepID=UPI001297926E|nr:hypothetical protein [Streptomyces kaniharaensis]
MTNHRTALATAALALGLAALVTGCGPDDPDPAPAAAPPASTTATAAPTTPAPTASAAPTTPAPTASAAASAAVEPCHQDPARPETVRFNSATTGGGTTKVNVTPVNCTHKVGDEQAVEYTPTGDPASYVLAKNAVVQVVEPGGKGANGQSANGQDTNGQSANGKGTNGKTANGKGAKERTITPAELPGYKLAGAPYFTIHRDGQGRVTAMKEVDHP